ncbi:MAG: DUF4340 domain-containing protein [Clostridia bacterium]|nr:DUF4340 domain-containing protein [Clostridia bacterium]
MDKKIRNLLILVGILALLCIGYAVTGLLMPDGETETEAGAEEGTTALFRVTEDGLTALSFTYDKDGDGTAEFWDFLRSEDGNTWKWTGDADVPLGSSLFYTYSSTLASATASKVIRGVTEAQLAEYGLEDPRKTVYFTDAAGGEQSFCIGAYNAYNGTYCAYINEDKTTVYLVGSELLTAFEVPIESFVSHDDLPAFEPEDLISLTLVQGERTVVVTRVIPETETGGDGEAVWMRSVDGGEPVQVADDLAASLELLVGDMDYLTCYSVTAGDFAEYGLEQDTTCMTILYRKTVGGAEVETSFTLTLGATDKYGYYYANPEGTPLTMLLGGAVFHKVMTYDDGQVAAGDETAAE